MKNFIVSICCIMLSFISADAQNATAKINSLWLEHDVTVNGRAAMNVHCDFNVDNMLGKTGYIALWIKGPNGNWHNINSDDRISSGIRYFKSSFTPRYNSSHYNDYKYSIYVSDLNLLSGKNEYKIVATILDTAGNNIAQSDYISFTGTGSQNSNNDNYSNRNQNNNYNQNNSGNTNTWREELGYGGFVIVTQYPSGGQQRIRYRFCPNCNGSTICKMCASQTAQCPFCQGSGYIISAGYGTYIPCYNCKTSGSCTICGGTGKCKACEISDYPGYVIASTTYLDAYGNVTSKDKADYNNYGGNSGNDNNKRNNGKQTCPDCGGTRLYHGGTSPEYAEPNRELVGLYHSAGSRCTYCGHYDRHWHSKCPTCKHYPGTQNPYR